MKKNSGFIAQTRLYTNSPAQHGLKAIEDIQIGDKVLCMPELGGGTPIYKTVLHIVNMSNNPFGLSRPLNSPPMPSAGATIPTMKS